MFGKVRNGWKADNIDVKIFSPESLKCPPFFSKKYLFWLFTWSTSINKKGNNFACCSMKNKCRKLIFLLFSSSRVDLFVKKQNCQNLSLIGSAKWPDKICECVRVNSGLNCKMETRTIECVAFFYHEGAKGDDFIQKNKFRCCVDSSQWGSVVKLGEHVR